MKAILTIFCIFFGLNLMAQNSDSFAENKARFIVIRDSLAIENSIMPLIVINGFIFNEGINRINPDDVALIGILGQPGATNIYGERGKNGVILINTKKLNENYQTLIRRKETLNYDSTTVIVDGEISDKKLKELDPNQIFSLNLLKYDSDAGKSLGLYKHNVAIILTNEMAVSNYVAKLSRFSRKYRNYLKENNNNDAKLTYIINGTEVDKSNLLDFIKTLYDIQNIEIKAVTFKSDNIEGIQNGGTVIITSKK